ncbi:MAG: 30S ribosomal protein S2 [Planctomycetota bacterium]|jgi:small subunit ribosomal protein S2
MPIVTARELIAAGVHFGHQTSRWNPKMARYIWGKRNKIHVIDIRETIKGIIEAVYFLRAAASGGGRFMFIGTKRQARDIVRREGTRTGMPFVAERWLGGTLTNLAAIRGQVKRIDELERIESSGEINSYNKKMISAHNREKRKLLRNLEGIRSLDRLPTAAVVVDPQKETIAVAEAYKLRIPIIALIDTDCDPDPVDIPIPANDDAMRSLDAVFTVLGKAVIEGRLAGGLPIPKEAMTAPEGEPAADAEASSAEASPAEASPAETPPAEGSA